MRFNNQKTVTGRKEYKCTYCEEVIHKDTKHVYVKITPWCHRDNESFDVWRIHIECFHAGNDFYYDDCEHGVFNEVGMGKQFIEYRNEWNKNQPNRVGEGL